MHRGVRTEGRVSHYILAVLALALATGCGPGWERVAVGPEPIPERRALQVFHAGRLEQWHGVRITADSISGVPYFRPPRCDECRIALPLTGVDSVRQGYNNEQQIMIGVVLAIPLVLLLSRWLSGLEGA